jgi:putative endonuclease
MATERRLDAKRVAAFRYGLSAETRAAVLLRVKCYRVVARRYKTPFGEVDIVARRGDTLVFVEVKARLDIDAAADALSPRQRKRIVGAAQAWLVKHPHDAQRNIRFDVILVAPWRLPRHIVAAFDAGG